MTKFTTSLCAAALAFTPLALIADNHGEKKEAKKEATETKKADQEITVIVPATNPMSFDKKTIEIKAGETISLTLDNQTTLPKLSMGHNLIILKKDADMTAYATKAMGAKDTEFVPADEEMKAMVIAHTKLLGAKEKDTITFSIKEPGEYKFLCTFPGHYAVMNGTITVK